MGFDVLIINKIFKHTKNTYILTDHIYDLKDSSIRYQNLSRNFIFSPIEQILMENKNL